MKHIPNAITCLNLFAGCLSILMTLESGNFFGAFLFITLAALFDFFDGFAARILNAKSAIGVQLDSLADIVSFGVAPGFMIFKFLNIAVAGTFIELSFVPWLAFMIPVFSALRLAKFNIDTRQTGSFLGLPVPADALFWAALVPALMPHIGGQGVITGIAVTIFIVIFSLLMISEIPMFSLKFKNYSWKDNKLPYIQIIVTILLTVFMNAAGISISILFYIAMSLVKIKLRNKIKSRKVN
jgi:CDP-diacylglycerol--serine O-phosphatidyltransferase